MKPIRFPIYVMLLAKSMRSPLEHEVIFVHLIKSDLRFRTRFCLYTFDQIQPLFSHKVVFVFAHLIKTNLCFYTRLSFSNSFEVLTHISTLDYLFHFFRGLNTRLSTRLSFSFLFKVINPRLSTRLFFL